MAAAMKRREPWDKRLERLEAENVWLRRENNRLKEIMVFLPPERFLIYYGLLVEAVFMTSQPEPEVRTRYLRRGGRNIPIRNWKARQKLSDVDQKLYELRDSIDCFLNPRDPLG